MRYRSGKEERKGKGLYLQFPLSLRRSKPKPSRDSKLSIRVPLFPALQFRNIHPFSLLLLHPSP